MDQQAQLRVFDEWLAEHQGLFFKVVRSFAFTPADQDDLFQEIAAQVWDSIPRFQGDSKPSTWVYRIALYTAVSWTRREGRRREGGRPLDDEAHALVKTNSAPDPRLEWLYEQIERMDPIDRTVMLLTLEGFTYKEVAATLGVSESAVGARLSRLKKRLTEKNSGGNGDGL